ncbi:hypothetical protein F4821DRAFT_263676 [Hypoxylon rubiginosum]|uniref:Uncharacterized protein n=1 Tax=Hypoxylon rubiginosum TaxID=110542 RepID=A0ACC0CQP7_9PEZI|nr:hypothetical protein F4821DRAFT_263676 [Hypoxylon rubiginosum]
MAPAPTEIWLIHNEGKVLPISREAAYMSSRLSSVIAKHMESNSELTKLQIEVDSKNHSIDGFTLWKIIEWCEAYVKDADGIQTLMRNTDQEEWTSTPRIKLTFQLLWYDVEEMFTMLKAALHLNVGPFIWYACDTIEEEAASVSLEERYVIISRLQKIMCKSILDVFDYKSIAY